MGEGAVVGAVEKEHRDIGVGDFPSERGVVFNKEIQGKVGATAPFPPADLAEMISTMGTWCCSSQRVAEGIQHSGRPVMTVKRAWGDQARSVSRAPSRGSWA